MKHHKSNPCINKHLLYHQIRRLRSYKKSEIKAIFIINVRIRHSLTIPQITQLLQVNIIKKIIQLLQLQTINFPAISIQLLTIYSKKFNRSLQIRIAILLDKLKSKRKMSNNQMFNTAAES